MPSTIDAQIGRGGQSASDMVLDAPGLPEGVRGGGKHALNCQSVSSLASLGEDESKANETDVSRIMESVKVLLDGIGEDCTREGLLDTPKRVAKALKYVTRGYALTGASALGGAIFHEADLTADENGIVLVRDIDFASTCEETLLPFYGKCHVAYVPQEGRIAGLSKMARMAEVYGRRLQLQQNITDQLVGAVHEELEPLGAAVVIRATHLSTGREVVTTARRGCFEGHASVAWQELECLLQMGGGGGAGAGAGTWSAIGGTGWGGGGGAGGGGGGGWEDGGPTDVGSAPGPPPAGSSPSSSSSEDEGAVLGRGGCGGGRGGGSAGLGDMESAVEKILRAMGEDPGRDGLRGSPARYVRRLLGATAGYRRDLDRALAASGDGAGAQAGGAQGEWAAYCDLAVSSQCEHHMLPFCGRAHVAVAPGPSGRALSRAQAARIVELFAHRLQVQERLTSQVADGFEEACGAAGVCVVLEATHMCMVARGVQKTGSATQTVVSRGVFKGRSAMRAAFLRWLTDRPAA